MEILSGSCASASLVYRGEGAYRRRDAGASSALIRSGASLAGVPAAGFCRGGMRHVVMSRRYCASRRARPWRALCSVITEATHRDYYTSARVIEVTLARAVVRVAFRIDDTHVDRGVARGARLCVAAMINVSAGALILLATLPVYFRKRAHSLAALASQALSEHPFSGAVIVYRAKRGDRVKILLCDSSALVLVWKQLQQISFRWPPIIHG